jgi:glucose/arabinose dehydrogenase
MDIRLTHIVRCLPLLALIGVAALLLAAGCPRPNGYTTVVAFPQANSQTMLGMYWIPGSTTDAVVLDKGGAITRINTADPAQDPSTFLDLTSRMIPMPAGEEGLLGLAFAPDYASSGRFYVHYTAEGGGPVRPDGQRRQSRISRFTAVNGVPDPNSERVILEVPQPYTNHNGGALAFGPDGYLYITLGDGGGAGDDQGNAQRLDTVLGKILRIDVSGDAYTIPPDNPFVTLTGARGEIWAYGLRNPWRLAFDPATGALWTADAGQDVMEEVDVVVPGGNYGWNRLEGSLCYNPPSGCDAAGTILPVAEYTHEFGCAIVGGYVYRGAEMPELQGWYVYGDFCSGRVWAVNAEGERKTPIPIADTGKRITSFAQDPAGEVYVITFDDTVEKLVRK